MICSLSVIPRLNMCALYEHHALISQLQSEPITAILVIYIALLICLFKLVYRTVVGTSDIAIQ